MIFTPASTRSSATSCAASVGTASTPDDDVLLLHHAAEVVVGRAPPAGPACRRGRPAGRPCRSSVSKIATTRKPWSAKMSELGDRLAEVPRAEQRDVVLARRCAGSCGSARRANRRCSPPRACRTCRTRQVTADLGGVDVRVVGELLGGDRLLAHLLGLREHLEVAGQPGGDAERQPLAPLGHVEPAVERVVEGHGSLYRVPAPAPLDPGRTRSFSTPSIATTGMRSPYWRKRPAIPADVDLLQLELAARADVVDHTARVLAEVAARLAVEGDDRHAAGRAEASRSRYVRVGERLEKRAAPAIMAALSVQSAISGTQTSAPSCRDAGAPLRVGRHAAADREAW